MSSTKRLFCPHCGNAILLKFFDYAAIRPGCSFAPLVTSGFSSRSQYE